MKSRKRKQQVESESEEEMVEASNTNLEEDVNEEKINNPISSLQVNYNFY